MARYSPRRRRDPIVAVAAWAAQLGTPGPEGARSRRSAHVGGIVAVASLLGYLSWRIGFTLPEGHGHVIAWVLVVFEAVPLLGLVQKTVSLWNIDCNAPPGPTTEQPLPRVVVLIPTYNEPRDVVAPTVAAACALRPHHETWVLDDGDRPWVSEMCASFGARYVQRPRHEDAKAGNINHALGIMEAEQAAGVGGADIVAVLDCDHVPLDTFLSSTLGWFDDPRVALVQGPQAFYNQGAFDDDGFTGEQGLFFNVLMPARHSAEAGPFWCGSTALLRVEALRQVGGVATGTITEDLHTTLNLIRAGWKTVYHHQTLAVGLAPETPAQYLLQRRRWGMGAMQILVRERLWAAKKWMSWRNFQEYLTGTLWWLEGIATLVALAIPVIILLSGARTSTASPVAFSAAFVAMFTARLWGAKRLLRNNIHWPTAFALRVMRVPVGMACLWWLVSRQDLAFAVTPKGGSSQRARGRAPRILWILIAVTYGIVGYAAAGVERLVPWRTSTPSTVASGLWLLAAGAVLLLGVRRIRAPRYATSRRNAPRIGLSAPVRLKGTEATLIDISVGGAALRIDGCGEPPQGLVALELPGSRPLLMQVVGAVDSAAGVSVSLRVRDGDWPALRALSLWLFHTPPGAVRALPEGVPVVAAIKVTSPDRQDQEVKVPVVAPAFTSTTAIPTESAA